MPRHVCSGHRYSVTVNQGLRNPTVTVQSFLLKKEDESRLYFEVFSLWLRYGDCFSQETLAWVSLQSNRSVPPLKEAQSTLLTGWYVYPIMWPYIDKITGNWTLEWTSEHCDRCLFPTITTMLIIHPTSSTRNLSRYLFFPNACRHQTHRPVSNRNKAHFKKLFEVLIQRISKYHS